MRKRIGIFFLTLLGIVSVTGCTKVQDLTDEQTQLIAEYAAEALLKYDTAYTDHMKEAEQESDTQEAATETTDTQEEATTQAQTTEQVTTETSSQPVTEAAETKDITDIAQILDLSDVSIRYKEYTVTDQYPSKDAEGKFIYLDAPEGYKLLVLSFDVSNTSDAPTELSLLDAGLAYRLDCNGAHSAVPMLTILLEDLNTYQIALQPEQSEEAVLIFQIADDMAQKLDTMDLYIQYQNTENHIQILGQGG